MVPYIIVASMILSLIISSIINKKLTKKSTERKPSIYSGDEIAKKILVKHKLNEVVIKSTDKEGEHYYNPFDKFIQFGPDVFKQKTIYSMAIGSHEASHAVKYQYLRFLNIIVNYIRNWVFIPLLIAAFFIDLKLVHNILMWMFLSLMVFDLLIVVLDEFNTNRRSLKELKTLTGKENVKEVKKIYTLMNLTYVSELPFVIKF